MKKLKSILFIMLFVLFPSTVFASSGSEAFPLGVALRNGSICFNTHVGLCTNSFI